MLHNKETFNTFAMERKIRTYGGYFGIYELRTEFEGNIFRTFFIFDEGNIVVLFKRQNK